MNAETNYLTEFIGARCYKGKLFVGPNSVLILTKRCQLGLKLVTSVEDEDTLPKTVVI